MRSFMAVGCLINLLAKLINRLSVFSRINRSAIKTVLRINIWMNIKHTLRCYSSRNLTVRPLAILLNFTSFQSNVWRWRLLTIYYSPLWQLPSLSRLMTFAALCKTVIISFVISSRRWQCRRTFCVVPCFDTVRRFARWMYISDRTCSQDKLSRLEKLQNAIV